MVEPDWDQFPNFSRPEMACKCCGRAEMDDDFMHRLQTLRDKYNKPMRITSAYRCASHPVEAAKETPGAHNTGRAVDVAVTHGDAYALMRIAMQIGFTGVGVQQKGGGKFIHLDDIGPKECFANNKTFVRPTVWSY
jgi:zinc D-Ala-D-Ala carboxypeptidase